MATTNKKTTSKNVTTKKTVNKKVAAKKKSSDNTNKETCFIIMPFGGWFDTYYRDIYCAAIGECNLQAKRADDLFRASSIIQDIWRFTKEAKVILADLTNKNPNVFYELGLAHALAKPAVLITQNIEDVPFDLRGLRIIEYNKNAPDWGEKLKKDLVSAITETLDSPLETIPTTYLEATSKKKSAEVSQTELELLDMKQDIESLKKQITTKESIYRDNMRRPVLGSNEALIKIKELSENSGMARIDIIKYMHDRYNIPMSWLMKNV